MSATSCSDSRAFMIKIRCCRLSYGSFMEDESERGSVADVAAGSLCGGRHGYIIFCTTRARVVESGGESSQLVSLALVSYDGRYLPPSDLVEDILHHFYIRFILVPMLTLRRQSLLQISIAKYFSS